MSEQSFQFSPENLARAESIVRNYPAGKQASAVLPLLDIAQRQSDNWLPEAVQDYVADFLGIPRIHVREVASFYSMFNLKPVGRYQVHVCRTTPCWLRGADGVVDVCKRKLGIHSGQTTGNGMFTLSDIECLGACVNAPVVQVNDSVFENVSPEDMGNIIDSLTEGRGVPSVQPVSRKPVSM